MQITFDVPPEKVTAVTAAVVGILNGTSSPASASWRDEIGFPKLKNINGVMYMLKSPLNPDWKTSPSDYVFGGVTADGVRYLADPSNADAKHSPRSPAGYPLIYGMEPGGVNSERMRPRILYDGVTHESDLMIADYDRRVVERNANLAQWQVDANIRNAVLQPGAIDISSLNAEDLMFLGTFMSEIGVEKVGPRDIEKAFYNWFRDGTSPLLELPVTAQILERKHQPYDWSGYHGPVRALIPRLN